MPEKTFRILIPESGGDAGLLYIKYMKESYPQHRYIAMDSNIYAPSRWIADKFYPVPKYIDTSFFDHLMTIIETESIDIIAPTFEYGHDIFSKVLKQFPSIYCTLDIESAAIFQDKLETFHICTRNNISTIDTCELSSFSDNTAFTKFYIKPQNGAGSKDNFTCNSKEEVILLKKYLDKNSPNISFIVQPLITGTHWSVDLFVNADQSCIISTRKTNSLNGSKNISTDTLQNESLKEVVRSITKTLNLKFFHNIEFFEVEGQYILLEINSRFGGGTIYSQLSGYKFFETSIEKNARMLYPDNSLERSFTRIPDIHFAPIVRGVKVMLWRNKEAILMTEREDTSVWVLPGGGIDHNETSKDAAYRELKEETGIESKDLKYLGTVVQKGKSTQCYDLYMATIDDSNQDTFVENSEVRGIRYINRIELPNYVINKNTISLISNFQGTLPHMENIKISFKEEILHLLSKGLLGLNTIIKIIVNLIFRKTFRI